MNREEVVYLVPDLLSLLLSLGVLIYSWQHRKVRGAGAYTWFVAVVDVWDALSSDRPYRQAWSKDMIIAHIQDESSKYFDPDIVHIFIAMLENGEI